jgi:uncharacterized protein (TIGR03437 family)
VAGSSTLPELQTSQESIELTALVGGASPSQAVNITLTEPGPPQDFTAAASSTEGWLTVTPFSGKAPTTLTIGVNPASVSTPGRYEGSVRITSLATAQELNIPVIFNLAERAIIAEPTSLNFVQQQRGVPPEQQTIQISANSPSSYEVTEAPSWLRIEPTRGSTPSMITVWPQIAALPPGTNTGSFRITGPNNQLTIPVSLVILPPSGPTATPDAVTFTYQLGNPAPAPQAISIGTTGDPITFTTAASTQSGVNWLAVAPNSGATPATLTASVDTASLVPGQHTGAITVATTDGSTQHTVPVTLNVSASAATIQGILHGATLTPTPISPGQIVTITGTGLGPATGVIASPTAAGAYDTRLADIRVLFDGVPAPLLFVRNDQINAVVPYALHGRLSSRVQIESGTNFSIPIEAKVVETAPGLFTTGSAGRGQAAALNSDMTPNSAANPAERGTVITIFGTGEGQTDPAGQDGRIILTDLRRPLLPVTATIAGRTAEVLYAGSASGLVSGVLQVNLRIPEDIDTGNVPLEIQAGGATSQSGVTIAVR